ncbi:MAG: hypothetical protein JOZ65_03700 [Chloroflexi bacterium]|nr:hypothetical protein [Chloroflexota bacterium]
MLTLGLVAIGRRRLLLGAATLAALTACARVPPRAPEAPTPAAMPELDAWRAEADAMLADGLQTLRTFEAFAAYRVSISPSSDRRSATELLWDPPTGAEWDFATHVAHGLRGRADQLFRAVTSTTVDATLWRDQRGLADIVHDIGAVGDALTAYRDRLDRLPPGDAAAALSLLDGAWSAWEQTASRLGLSRAEAIGCAA